MFKFVHHVEYSVRNRDQMVAYMERTFGMRPDMLFEDARRRKEAQYRVGQTVLKFVEDTVPGTGHSLFLEKHGPGVHHVAWEVDNIFEVGQTLIAQGSVLEELNKPAVHQSDEGYYAINIDPKHSLGVYFQIVEEPSELGHPPIDASR